MITKQDVINAVDDYGIASAIEAMNSDSDFPEIVSETAMAADKAYEYFLTILDEFEQSLLTKESKPCKQ